MSRRLGVLVSGGGTNMQSIIDACEAKIIDGEVVVVISSSDTAYALVRADTHGIPKYVYRKKDFDTAESRDKRIVDTLKEYDVDYVILAGYLGILTKTVIDKYPNRIVNIHPALLPKYGGRDYYGIKVHEAVIAAKEPFSGATVHFVDEGADTGLIIRQQSMPVEADDTAESLQQKILKNIEHKLLTEVVKDLCDGKIEVVDDRVNIKQ